MASYGLNPRGKVPEHPIVDIVVIHGLGGGDTKTWTDKETKKVWVDDPDFLKDIRPEARLMTFGYNANVFSDVANSRVIDHATDLLDGLMLKRLDCETRPIIFIAHSLGGLVVKKALVDVLDAEYKPVIDSTKAIIFLGTPHDGSDSAASLEIVQRMVFMAKLKTMASSGLPAELKSFSDTVCDINKKFVHFAPRLKMVCIYETRSMRIPPFGKSVYIVAKHSGEYISTNCRNVGAVANHKELSKFPSATDQRYLAFESQLRYLINVTIKEPARAAAETEQAAPPTGGINRVNSIPMDQMNATQPAATTDTEHDLVMPVMTAPRKKEVRTSVNQWSKPERNKFLKSLTTWAASNEVTNSDSSYQEGTCGWILNEDKFKNWREGPENALFIVGPSGWGKSVMAKFISKKLAKSVGGVRNLVKAFFCKMTGIESGDPPILQFILYHLLDREPGLFSYVPSKFNLQDTKESFKNASALWDLIEDMLNDKNIPETYFIVDGLDECSRSFKEGFLQRAISVFAGRDRGRARGATSPEKRVKILFTCRRTHETKIYEEDFPPIFLGKHKDEIDADVSLLIREQLNLISTSGGWPSELRTSTYEKVLQKADGMFLWTSNVLKEIEQLENPSRESIGKVIDASSRDMNQYWLRQLKSLHESGTTHAATIIDMLLHAQRALSSEELGVALSINAPGRQTINEIKATAPQNMGGILLRCAPLLKEHNGKYELCHHSLEELLKEIPNNELYEAEAPSFSFDFQISHLKMALRCLRVLQCLDFANMFRKPLNEVKSFLQDNTFISYAADNWHIHLRLAEELAIHFAREIFYFLDPTYWPFIMWDRWRQYCSTSVDLLYVRNGNISTAMIVIVEFRLDVLLNIMLAETLRAGEKDVKGFSWYWNQALTFFKKESSSPLIIEALITPQAIKTWDLIGMTPLHHAAVNGNVTTAELLLSCGADIDEQDVLGRSSLSLASLVGNLDMLKCLISHGCNLNLRSVNGETAMNTAISNGWDAVAKELLLAGADTDTTDNAGWRLLNNAADRDSILWLEAYFRETRSDVNTKDIMGYAPLHHAVAADNPRAAKILLDNNANLNLKTGDDEDGWTPLMFTCHNMFFDSTSLLLSAIPDEDAREGILEARNGTGATPLFLATESKDLKTVSILLNASANVDAQDNFGETCLYRASSDGNLDLVRLLLDFDADTDISVKTGVTALQVAASKGYLEIMKELLKSGASIDKQSTEGWTAVMAAISGGEMGSLELLLRQEPKPNLELERNVKKTAIMLAVSIKREDMVLRLLENGASFRVVDQDGLNVLALSITSKMDKVTEAILATLAPEDPCLNAQSRFGWTPLMLAASRGREEIFETILALKPDIHLKMKNGGTLAHAAALGTNTNLMKRVKSLVDLHELDKNDASVLHWASESKNSKEMVEFLVQDVELYQENSDGNTALHKAARFSSSADTVAFLLEKGLSMEKPNRFKETPFFLAVLGGDPDVVKLFLDRKANLYAPNFVNAGPIHAAAQEGKKEIIDMLLKVIDINFKPDMVFGITALHLAAGNSNAYAVKALLDAGFDPNTASTDGSTALHNALFQFDRCLKHLILYGANIDAEDSLGRSCFGYWISQSMFIPDTKNSPGFRRGLGAHWAVNRISEVLKMDPFSFFGIDGLALVVFKLGDIENAEKLFKSGVQDRNGVTLAWDSYCTACPKQTYIEGTMFICRSCDSTFLCKTHMDEYPEGSSYTRKLCKNHDFHEMSIENCTALPRILTPEIEAEMKTYLSELALKYTAIAAEEDEKPNPVEEKPVPCAEKLFKVGPSTSALRANAPVYGLVAAERGFLRLISYSLGFDFNLIAVSPEDLPSKAPSPEASSPIEQEDVEVDF